MTITLAPIGGLVENETVGPTASLTFTPSQIGDVMVLLVTASATAAGATSVTSTWAAWNRLAAGHNANNQAAEIWFAPVLFLDEDTVEVTIGTGSTVVSLGAQQFTAGVPCTWAQDGGSASSGSNSTSGNFPNGSPAGSDELYLGVGQFSSPATGPDPDVTNVTWGAASGSLFVCILDASTPNTYAPDWEQTGVGPIIAQICCRAMLAATPISGALLPQVPAIKVQVAPNNNPLDPSPTWADIGDSVLAFTTMLGKQHDFDRTEPSTAQITVDNRKGLVTPWNTNSPLYSATPGCGMVPGKPLRITAEWDTVTEPIFYGFTDSFTPTTLDELNQEGAIQATDVFKLLALKYLVNGTLYPDAVLALSPALYLRLSDGPGSFNAQDSSGNGLVSPLSGLVGFGAPSAILYDPSTGIDFSDGGGNYGGFIQVPIGPPSSSPFNWSVVGSFTSDSTTSPILLQIPSVISFGNIFVEALIISNGGELQLVHGTQPAGPISGLVVDLDGPVVNDGKTHWFAITWNSAASFYTLYVDGVNYGSAATGYPWGIPGIVVGGVQIYAGGSTFAPSFEGTMQDVAFFDAELTQIQIQDLLAVATMLGTTQYTGERIADALTVAGWGSYPRSLATGTVLCGPETSPTTVTTCADYIMTANDTEAGLLFQDESGTIQFYDRHYAQIRVPSTTPVAILADRAGGGALHYEAAQLIPTQDDGDLWTDVQAQRNEGVMQEVVNATAGQHFGSRSLQRTALLMFQDSDALILAQYLLLLYQNPLVRVSSVTLSSVAEEGANIPYMLSCAVGDLVTFERQGTGESPFTSNQIVEQITHNWDATQPRWLTTLTLSPFESNPAGAGLFLILNSSTKGILDTNLVGA